MVTLEQVIQKWNKKADEHNQWDALSDDEKFDLVGKEYDARIKELEDGIRSLKATHKPDGSLSHSGVIAHFEACEQLFKLIGIE